MRKNICVPTGIINTLTSRHNNTSNFKPTTTLDNSKLTRSSFTSKNPSQASFNNEKLISRLLEVLKMRIEIENLKYKSDKELNFLIKNNLDLIDLKHIEINSINNFVDDLIEIIIKENKHKESEVENNEYDVLFKTINYLCKDYRPCATTEDKFNRRRTIEIVLEKPKGIAKGPIKFNNEKEAKVENVFYKDGEEIDNYLPVDIDEIKMKVIDDVSNKFNSKSNL